MRRTLTIVMLLACSGIGWLLSLGVGQVAAQESGQTAGEMLVIPTSGAGAARGLSTAVHRIGDEEESQAAADPYALPAGAVPAAYGAHQNAGYFYSSYEGASSGGYFDATGGRSPNTWGGLWGYGDDCHVGAARFEYLMWFSRGRSAPPLVTTSPANTALPVAGVLPDAQVLYGGNSTIGEDMRSGARITLNRLLADECTWVEGRFWGLEDSTERFYANGNDFPILARPFVNTVLQVEDALLVNYPGITSNGAVNVLSKNDMFAADAWLRRTWTDDGCTRIDVLAGYQFARIDDFIGITNLQQSIDPLGAVPVGTLSEISDAFQTQNEFHGAQFGMMYERRKGCWSVETLAKIGLGNMRQRVAISGNTVTTEPNAFPVQTTGGLLALPSNIGVFQRNQFAFIPEVNVNLCYNFSPSWKVMVGYSFIYFSDVVLAGNQIDREVNFSQVPGPPIGALRPRFDLVNSDFLVQGISLGGEYRW